MDKALRKDAEQIVRRAIEDVMPDQAVRKALAGKKFPGRVFLVSVGKAGWKMAKAALEALKEEQIPLTQGMVITKYYHVEHQLPGVSCFEAGHPVPDDKGFEATRAVLEMTADLKETDTVIFLLSGGASALFELPLVSGQELKQVTEQLLKSGAEIREINALRKRLSAVKGGRFAQHCAPARVYGVILSDILGDPLDMIGSGPAAVDRTTGEMVEDILKKYRIRLSPAGESCLKMGLPRELPNVENHLMGSVRELCRSAAAECSRLGYEPVLLTDRLSCEAREAGSLLGSIAATHAGQPHGKMAWLAGGETVVHLKGRGQGGRNQELALSAALQLEGVRGAALISAGSDGTDGPTNAAGGYVDGETVPLLAAKGIQCREVLDRNDAYHGLEAAEGLVITGPTGTNVNDLTVVLLN